MLRWLVAGRRGSLLRSRSRVPACRPFSSAASLADNRTTALLASSVTALETLGVWTSCADQAAPLEPLRIIDDTQRLWRAPEARFEAEEIGLPAFAWNIENRHLLAALSARCDTFPALQRLSARAQGIKIRR